MKRGTIIKCVKDVIMEDGDKTFTKGKSYKTYPYSYQEGWDGYKTVTCAKNDNNERHIIIDKDEGFFNSHFIVAENN